MLIFGDKLTSPEPQLLRKTWQEIRVSKDLKITWEALKLRWPQNLGFPRKQINTKHNPL